MHMVLPDDNRGSVLRGLVAAFLLVALVAFSHSSFAADSAPDPASTRAQLSIGYTLLYQEADGRKAIGEDMAKDFAPLAGKSGRDFEREALLMFYDSLNEQRHLTGVMLKMETNLELSKFLTSTKAQLEERYSRVGALLNRSYFTH